MNRRFQGIVRIAQIFLIRAIKAFAESNRQKRKEAPMEQREIQEFSFSDIRVHPNIITDILDKGEDVSLMLRRQGDKVTAYSHRTYSDEVNDILEEAMAEYEAKKQAGYDKKQVFRDFKESVEEISKYI
ncbi:MAG: hypothetical protein DRI57_22160 [Deltaproteobacteria bacterium]|nr:MAG: hypothetical protein DRI57_22160 [Deltaproteobacteria bacterium]